MPRLIKALHLIAVAMFFGSILGHMTAGLIPGVQDDPKIALIARQAINVATTYLTVPGLILLLLTGAFMVIKGRLPIFRTRWLLLHAIFGVLIAINAAAVLYPTGQELLGVAAQLAEGAAQWDTLRDLKGREAAFGATNLLLCLAAVIVAAVKPRFGTSKP